VLTLELDSQLLSFPGEERKEEECLEEARYDGVVPGQEITIHLALMQVTPRKKKSGFSRATVANASNPKLCKA
jgi:hypothetical protein